MTEYTYNDLDTIVKIMGKPIRYDSVSVVNPRVNHVDSTLIFKVDFNVVYRENTYVFNGYVEFPNTYINEQFFELLITSSYLHALNLQPITNSKISIPTELSKSSINLCNDLYSHNYQIWHNIFGRATSLKDYIHNYNEILISDYSNFNSMNKVAVAMSGGKESTLCYQILQDLQYDTVPIFIDYNGITKRKEGQRLYNHLKNINKDPIIIHSNLIDLMNLVPSDFGKHSMYLSPTILLILAYCYNKKISGLIVGNEYDNTCPITQYDVLYYGDNYEQSNVFERKISKYSQDLGLDILVLSPLYNLSETQIQKMLMSSEYQKFQESCLEPIWDGKNYISCQRCMKCQRIAAIQTALGYKSKYFNPSIIYKDHSKIFNSLDGIKEKETIIWLLHQQGYVEVNGKYHDSVFKYIIDDQHPYVQNNISKYIKNMITKSGE